MNNQDIEKLKNNKEAFQFWPIEWQEWARENSKKFRYLDGVYKMTDSFEGGRAYRLRSDYELPEEKKAGWVEYEIVKQHGILVVPDFFGATRALSEAIDYAIDRGMCPQFTFKEYKEWTGWNTLSNLSYNDKPATPVKIRVWEGKE